MTARKWTRQDVIRQIVYRDNRHEGLCEEVVRHDAPELYAAACEHFGTWETALRYAGIDGRRAVLRQTYSAEAVVREIHGMCADCKNISTAHVSYHRRHLYRAALRHFGSWKEALRSAGVNVAHVRTYPRNQRPSGQQIIDAIVKRHQLGLSLRWGDVARDNNAFALRAKTVFRSWRNAVLAAGVVNGGANGEPAETRPDIADGPDRCAESGHDGGQSDSPTVSQSRPATQREMWTPARVVAELQAWYQQSLSLSSTLARRPLVRAADRYFGGWHNALVAAGLEPPPRVGPPKDAT